MSNTASSSSVLTTEEIADLRTFLQKHEVQDLFERYVACIDLGQLEHWPNLFTEECSYRIIARENFDETLPLAIMRCESRGMLQDRVTAIRQTMTYMPRHTRHFLSAIRADLSEEQGKIAVSANFAIIQSRLNEFSTLHCAGRYVGTVVREKDGALRFNDLDCVFDTGLIANSIIYPF